MLASARRIVCGLVMFARVCSRYFYTNFIKISLDICAVIWYNNSVEGKEIPEGKEERKVCWDFMGIFTEGIVFLLHQ